VQPASVAIGDSLPPIRGRLRGLQIAVSGGVTKSADFNNDGAADVTVPQFGAFLATYDSADGSFVWAQSNGDGSADVINAGNAVVWDSRLHVFDESLDIGGRSWLRQVEPGGHERWRRSLGGTFSMKGLAVDRGSNIYVAGIVNGPVDLNRDGVFDDRVRGQFDMVLASYSPEGVHRWTKTGGGSDNDSAASVAVSSWDSVWVGGGARSTVLDFDDDPQPELHAESEGDGFFVRYEPFVFWLGNLDHWSWPGFLGQPMLPFHLEGGFGEFELDDPDNLSVQAVFVPGPNAQARPREITQWFTTTTDGCSKASNACVRYAYQGKVPPRELLVVVKSNESGKPARFTLRGRDAKGVSYAHPPAVLWLNGKAPGKSGTSSLTASATGE
jgi:hypothetical protein